MDPVVHFWEVLEFTVPWAAVAGILGVASVFASAWLTNQREARMERAKKRRFDEVARACDELLRSVEKLEKLPVRVKVIEAKLEKITAIEPR